MPLDEVRITSRYCPECGREFPNTFSSCPDDNCQLHPSGGPLIGVKINQRYLVEAAVGSGGWSSVYRAQDVSLKRTVAIKVLHASLAGNLKNIKRFKQEAAATSAMVHPNIVTLFDSGFLPEGQPYMVMEFIQGQTLAETIAANGELSTRRTLKILIQCCSALTAIHESGTIHRDIKPSNILLQRAPGQDEYVKILDFGIAKLLQSEAQLTRTGEAMGTAAYMSIEQYTGRTVDARSDLYSLGCVMFECLTGKAAFATENVLEALALHSMGKPPSLVDARPDLFFPQSIQHILSRLLEKDPDNRYPNATALKDALEDTVDSLAQTVNAMGSSAVNQALGQKASSNKFAGLLIALIGCAVGISAAGTYHFLSSSTESTKPSARHDQLSNTLAQQPHEEKHDQSPDKQTHEEKHDQSLDSQPHEENHGQSLDSQPHEEKHGQSLGRQPRRTPPGTAMSGIYWDKSSHALDLNGQETDDASLEQALSSASNIESLNVADSRISDAALTCIRKHCPDLRILILENTKISNAGLEELGRLSNLSQLSLNYTNVTDAGMAKLRSLPLLKLWLNGTPVTGRGLASLAAARLNVLGFGRSKIGDHDLEIIQQTFPHMSWLWLDYSAITDVGVRQTMKFPALDGLIIDGCSVTDAGVLPLLQVPRLQELSLKNTKVTAAAYQKLCNAGLRVSWSQAK